MAGNDDDEWPRKAKRGTQGGSAPSEWEDTLQPPWYLSRDLVGDTAYRYQGVALHSAMGMAGAAMGPLGLPAAVPNLGYAAYSVATGRTDKRPNEFWSPDDKGNDVPASVMYGAQQQEAPWAEAMKLGGPEQVADASDALQQLEALAGGRVDDTYRDVISKRNGNDNLKWLEDYAGSQGMIEPGDTSLTQPEQPEGEQELWPGSGLSMQDYGRAAKAVAGDVGSTFTQGAGVFLGKPLKGLENGINGLNAATAFIADWLNKNGYGLPGGLQVTDPETGAFDPKILSDEGFQAFQERGGNSDISIPGSSLADNVEGITPNLVGGVLQFLAPLGLVGKATGGFSAANTVGGFGKRIGQYALADLAAWDGQEGNLANFIQSYPNLQNPVTEWLATTEETPELEGRLKNALAAAPLNVGVELVFQWLKGVKEARRLKALTDSKTVEEAAAKIETGQVQLRPRTVEDILGSPDGELVSRPDPAMVAQAESILRPVETGVPDDVAAKSLLPESTRAPDIQPGMVRLYRAEQKGSDAPLGADVTDDLGKAQADLKSLGGLESGNQVAYWDVPAERAAQLREGSASPSAGVGAGGSGTPPNGSPPAPPTSPPASGPSPGPFSSEVYVNWSRIDTPDDVKRTIGMMADAMAPEIEKATRGKVSNKQTAALAGDENAWALLLGERKGNLPNAHEQLAMRKLWASSGQKLLETAKLAATGGDAEMYAFRKMMAIHNTIQQQVIGVRTETARALQQWKMPAGSEAVQLAQLKLMIETGGGLNHTRDLATKMALLADNPIAMDNFVRNGWATKTGNALREAWINALLSGPKTHIVNAMSNATVLANTLTERLLAGKIGEILDPVDGAKAAEATYMLTGARMALPDALSAAWRVMRTGESTFARSLGVAGHEISAYTPAISAEAFDVKGNHLAKGIDMLGSLVRIPGTAMQSADEFFKIINARMEIHAQAVRMASEEAERGLLPDPKVDPLPFKSRIADIIANPPENIRLKAAEMAAYNTFTSEPGEITKSLLAFRNKVPGGWLIAPFINTPANILKYSFERTPLAPLSKRIQADIQAGGSRRDLALARIGLGSIVMSVAYDLAMDGHVTGSGPVDNEKNTRERQALQRAGWQKYSFRFMTGEDADGNPQYRYFAYNRLDPIGLYFGMAADIADMARNMDYEDLSARQTFEQIAVAAIFSAAEGMMDKTYLSGFAGFADAILHSDTDAFRFVKRLAGSAVPAGVAEVTRQMDPYAKHTTDMISQLRSRIPYLSEGVPNRLDMWGDPIGYQSGLGRPYDIFSPVYSKATKATPIDREFFKLNYFPPDSVSIRLKGTEDSRPLDIRLRNRPDLINEFKITAGKVPASQLLDDNRDDMETRGGTYMSYVYKLEQLEDRNLKEALNDMVTGKLGQLSLDYEVADHEGKVKMIGDLFEAYRGAARTQLVRKHPIIQHMRDQIPARSSGGDGAPF